MNSLINVKNQDGVMVVSSREVAENFGKQHKHVLEALENIKAENSAVIDMFIESTYKAGTGKAYKEYLLTRDGFSLIVMGFTGQKALEWKLKYIDAFNAMEQSLLSLDGLSPQLQLLISIEMKQKEHDAKLSQIESKVESIKDVVALNPNDWRRDSRSIIHRIANDLGGPEHIKPVQTEIYQLLDERYGVSLSVRLTNKRRRMADEGVCKSKRDKLNKLDVIADDKKLIEGYVAIVKEMAVKYGISVEQEAT